MMLKKKTNRKLDWKERDSETSGIIDETQTITWYLFGIPMFTKVFTFSNVGNYIISNRGVGFGNN